MYEGRINEVSVFRRQLSVIIAIGSLNPFLSCFFLALGVMRYTLMRHALPLFPFHSHSSLSSFLLAGP